MSKLNELAPREGSTKGRMRVGRGPGSGKGKTAGRGVKGQKARTGVAVKGFEGGQMPLHRRLPKRGFKSMDRREFNEINVGDIEAALEAGRLAAGKSIDNAMLVEAGVLRRKLDGLRLLGNGELKSKVAITVDHASASARAAVEKAGGSVTVIEKKVLAADETKRAKTAAKRAKTAKPGKGD